MTLKKQNVDLDRLGVIKRRRYDLWLQAWIDSINLWKRKLSEAIVHLVGFQTSDSEEYYKHYLGLDALRDKNAFRDDMQVYYGISSKILDEGVGFIRNELNALLSNIDPAKCWYAQKSNLRKMAPFKEKFTFALSKMNPGTKMAMAVYTVSFANPSKSLHLETRLSSTPLNLQIADLHDNLCRSWFLIFAALDNMQYFLKIPIKNEALQQFTNVITQNPNMKKLWKQSQRDEIQKGDFVALDDCVGRVVGIKISNLGFKSFKVQFLFPNLHPKIKDDYFAAQSIQLRLASKREAAKYIKSIAARRQYSVTDVYISQCLQ